jgi:hypothetical protein
VSGTEKLTPIRVTAFAVGTPISTLVVEVTAADINRRLVYNLEVVSGVATGTIDVPAGEARTFTVTAFDDQHNVTHEGSETADVSPGNNPPLRVKLKPIVGEVEVTVTFGEYTVLVTPATATIDAAVSDQLQLEVTVLDPDDTPVQNPQVQWATTHPTLAAVSASGLVTGLADGSATTIATFEGVAGLSELTLTGFNGTAPTAVVTITPDPAIFGDDLTCTVTVSDADVHTFVFSWYDGPSAIRVLSLDGISGAQDVLPASETIEGTSYTCGVTVGTAEEVSSNTVVVSTP